MAKTWLTDGAAALEEKAYRVIKIEAQEPTTVAVSKTSPPLFAPSAENTGRASLRPVASEDYFFTAYSVAQ